MESFEFNSRIDSKRKVLMSLYWVNKKVALVEGCAPFYIAKIITKSTIYLSDGSSFIKLSQIILNDILKNIEANNEVKFEIKMGEEFINISIYKNMLSVSTKKTKDLEREIVEKLSLESLQKYPNVCSKFKTRVGME